MPRPGSTAVSAARPVRPNPAPIKLLAWDTETTGVDFGHAARPFFFTACEEDGTQTYFEWHVDPFTRMPDVPAEDLAQITALLTDPAYRLVGQNLKFDVRALGSLLPDLQANWPWDRTDDTLIAAHLLASNQPKDLTSLAVRWLGVNIEPYEKRLEEAVQACRRLCRQKAFKERHGEWAIADDEREDMPSAKGAKTWRFDYWLPRAVAGAEWKASEAYRLLASSGVGPTPPMNETIRALISSWRAGRREVPPVLADALEDAGYTDEYELNTLRGRTKAKPDVSGWAWYADGSSWERCHTNDSEWNAITRADGWEYHPPSIQEDGAHPWWTVLSEYANADSEATLLVWKRVWAEANRRGWQKLYAVRMETYRVTAEMERRRVTVKRDNLLELKQEFEEAQAETHDRCIGIAASLGHDLELPRGAGPNASLRRFMFDVLDVERVYSKKSKTPEPTLDKTAMEHYSLTLAPTSPAGTFVRNLLAWRKRTTALGYINSYMKFWTGVAPGVYALSPSYNMTGTDTLRFSCSQPNAQNISKQESKCRACDGDGETGRGVCPKCRGSGKDMRSVRYCFGPAPGREWWSMDAKNIELRIPFYASGEQSLIDLFEHPDDPPFYGSNHILNFSVVYPEVWADAVKKVGLDKAGPYCKKEYASTYYQWCKNGGFAIQYQAGERTADAAFHRAGAWRLLKSRFARLEAYNQECLRQAARYGYVTTIPDRDVDPDHGYPLLCTRSDTGGILPTVPLSYRIQGTAMQWTAKAMNRCDRQLREWRAKGWDGFMTLQVHDEIVFDLPKAADPVKDPDRSNLARIRVLKRLMEQGGQDIGIPTPVGCEYHADNWGEGVSVKA